MKALFSLLCGACLLGSAAHAQTTMPAIGAKNNKVGVDKTDASLNPRKEDPRGEQAPKRMKKHSAKMKMKAQPASTM